MLYFQVAKLKNENISVENGKTFSRLKCDFCAINCKDFCGIPSGNLETFRTNSLKCF